MFLFVKEQGYSKEMQFPTGSSMVAPADEGTREATVSEKQAATSNRDEPAIAKRLTAEHRTFIKDRFMLLAAEEAGDTGPSVETALASLNVDWVLGFEGLQAIFQRKRVTEAPIGMHNGVPRMPADAAVYGADLGLEALGLKPFEEKELETDRIRKVLPNIGTLKPHESGQDWETWFRNFEPAVVSRGVPLDRWIEVFRVHVSKDLEGRVEEYVQVCREKGAKERHLYAHVRDMLLMSEPAYTPLAY